MPSEQQMELPLVPAPTTPPGERHMAIDVSTLSNNPDGVIGSVGWVVFDPRDTGGANEHYFKTVDWDQQGRAYNWPKVQEWMVASGMARKAIINQTPPVPLVAAMTSVIEAFNKHRCAAIWANRAALNTIENAIKYCKKEAPWQPGQARDLTTCWATAVDMGLVTDLERHMTEPEDVPLGNAAFVARAVRHLYQNKMSPTPEDSVVK